MDKWTVLFFLWFSGTAVCWTKDFQLQNMLKLFTKYSEYCGSDSLCSATDKRRHSIKTEHHKCPSCSCSEECDYLRNCCLDESYTSCVPTTVSVNHFVDKNGVQMVSFCPGTHDIEYESCLQLFTEYNFLTNIPVYSLHTNKTYVNAKCSKCHGDNDIIPWRYYISCPGINIDIDDYTDGSSLWYNGMENGCTLTLTPPVNTFQRHCEVNVLIRTCNITGNWDVYDKEIEDACAYYRKPYELYENIFCFLCNTGKNQRNGLLLKKSGSKEKYMLYESVYNSTNDFIARNGKRKNSYAKSTTHYQQVLHYDDALVTFLEEYNTITGEYVANITFLAANLTESFNNILFYNDSLNESVDFEAAVNLTALYEEYVRSGGYRNWCSEEHRVDKIFPGFKARRDCSCDDNCYISASCCPDAAYFQRSTCSAAYIKFLYAFGEIINASYYFMIRKCPLNYKYRLIKLKCESYYDYYDYDLRNIPILNIESNNTYFNIYCYLCNTQQELAFPNLTNIKLWNVSLACSTLMFPTLKSSIAAVLQTASYSGCTVQYSTTLIDKVETCKPDFSESIGKCNTTGVVKSVSDSARYMCENIDRSLEIQSIKIRSAICVTARFSKNPSLIVTFVHHLKRANIYINVKMVH